MLTVIADAPLEDLVRLQDPDFFCTNPWPVYERLQREAPVFFHAPLRTWMLTKYDDVRHCAKTPELFSSAKGIMLHDALTGFDPSLFIENGEQIGWTDPPRHRELRRVASPPFTPASVEEVLDAIVPGEPFDWVAAVASKLPIHTSCTMLGLPLEFEKFQYWSDLLEAQLDPLPADRLEEIYEKFSTMVPYLEEHFEAKRTCPADDMISSLLAAELDNEALSAANVMMLTQTMIAAENDTTRAMVSGIAALFAEHPDQYEAVRGDRSMISGALEEVLRIVTPARGFCRQITADTHIRDRDVRAGERIYLAYDAANRDPEVFEDPHRFDVARHGRFGQVAFGYGTHVCIGAPIVRMETRVLLEQFVDRFSRVEYAGTPVRTHTILRSGWTELPVVVYR